MAAILDCGYDSSGTVGDMDEPTVSDLDLVLEVELVSEILPGPEFRGHVSLEETLGAVYGWVWCQYVKAFSWSMLYWPALEFCGEPPQVSAVRAGSFWSGFMSEARGLSWDRKSRYGIR